MGRHNLLCISEHPFYALPMFYTVRSIKPCTWVITGLALQRRINFTAPRSHLSRITTRLIVKVARCDQQLY
jgi:hypothetical protein